MSYTKAYENKPIWINNREPAINEQRLNALSGAVDVIDNRVIDLDDKRIENIAGVNTVNRQDGQVLAYNETTNKWENRYISGPEGSPSYTPLLDKPQINGHVLSGNLTGKDLLLDNKTTTNRDLSDSSEGGLLIHHIDGKSTQSGTPTPTSPVPIESVSVKVKTQSKNLIPFPYASGKVYTANGVTFTEYNDGTVVANGTTGSSSAYYYVANRTTSNWFLKEGDYALMGCPSGGSPTKYRLMLQGTSSTGSYETFANDYGTGAVATIPANSVDRPKQVNIEIRPNQTVTNLVFKPMVAKVEADGTYPTTYEKGYTSVADTSLVLRSIGDIKDELIFEDNKYKVLRRIDSVVLNGTMNFAVGSKPAYGVVGGAVISENDYVFPTSASVAPNVKSNRFVSSVYDVFVSDSGNGVMYWNIQSKRLSIRNDNMTSLQDWKDWFDTNIVEIQLVRKTPIVEELTDDAIKLLGLKSWNEQTHITLDSAIDTPITVEYATNNGNGRGLNGYTVALANEIKLNQLTMATMLSE